MSAVNINQRRHKHEYLYEKLFSYTHYLIVDGAPRSNLGQIRAEGRSVLIGSVGSLGAAVFLCAKCGGCAVCHKLFPLRILHHNSVTDALVRTQSTLNLAEFNPVCEGWGRKEEGGGVRYHLCIGTPRSDWGSGC